MGNDISIQHTPHPHPHTPTQTHKHTPHTWTATGRHPHTPTRTHHTHISGLPQGHTHAHNTHTYLDGHGKGSAVDVAELLPYRHLKREVQPHPSVLLLAVHAEDAQVAEPLEDVVQRRFPLVLPLVYVRLCVCVCVVLCGWEDGNRTRGVWVEERR